MNEYVKFIHIYIQVSIFIWIHFDTQEHINIGYMTVYSEWWPFQWYNPFLAVVQGQHMLGNKTGFSYTQVDRHPIH